MLSPGKHYEKVPKYLPDNLQFRAMVLRRCDANKRFRQGIQEACAHDIVFWINCLAEGTLVVTDRGNVPIEQVTKADLVWDGKTWVSQEGPAFQGCRPVISAYNIRLTPDHRVRTIHGWQDARYRYDREEVRTPDGCAPRRVLRQHVLGGLAVPVRLRAGEDHIRRQPQIRQDDELRLPPPGCEVARDVRNINLLPMERDDFKVQGPQESILRELRWARHQGMPALAQIREFSGGYGCCSGRHDSGPDRQRWGLPTRQLPLGEPQGTSEQYPKDQLPRSGPDAGREFVQEGNSRKDRDRHQCGSPENRFRLGLRKAPAAESETAKVYDLINCGPRRAFTVVDSQGGLLLVHNCFVWQFNPLRIGNEVGPFVCWAYQEKAFLSQWEKSPGLLWAVEKQKDVLIEKSREMGASVMCLLAFDWLARSSRNKHFTCLSRSRELVESASSDSLFWKLNFFHRHLPDWMQEGVEHTKFHYRYPTGSTIDGEATTEKSTVGGRATAIFLDEFSQMRDDFEILDRTSDTARCRIFNGTHKGLDTAFYQLSRKKGQPKIVMHWSDHPTKVAGLYESGAKIKVLDKTYAFPPGYDFVRDGTPAGGPCPGLRSAWYDEACTRKGSSKGIAEDIDIDPAGSISQVFSAVKIRLLIDTYARGADWTGHLELDKRTARPLGLEPSKKGKLRLWLAPTAEGKVPPGKYAIGGDISTGMGRTASCLSILDVETGEKVGEYGDATMDERDLAVLAVALCYLFCDIQDNPARLVWEIPGPGVSFGKKVIEQGFRNYHHNIDIMKDVMREKTDTPGWHSSPKSKRLLIEEYRSALYSCEYLNHSKEALEECLWFEYDASGNIEHSGIQSKNDPSGARLNHGDQTIADALTWMLGKGQQRDRFEPREELPPFLSIAWRERFTNNKPEQQIVWG